MHPFEHANKKVISYGDVQPGRLIVDGKEAKWEGDLFWKTKHGEASALWIGGKIAGLYNASMSDDIDYPIAELIPGDVKGLLWRCEAEDDSYIYGTVDVSDSGIIFNEVPEPPFPSWPAGSLPNALLQSKEVLEAVQNKSGALDLYGALCSVGWTHNSSGKEYLGSWVRAADLVCHLRDLAEFHTDFFLSGNEGMVTTEIGDLLGALGWVPSYLNETDEDREQKAVKLLSLCEARDPTEMPSWYAHWAPGLRDGDDNIAKIHKNAFIGKVTYEEWCRFWELTYIEDE